MRGARARDGRQRDYRDALRRLGAAGRRDGSTVLWHRGRDRIGLLPNGKVPDLHSGRQARSVTIVGIVTTFQSKTFSASLPEGAPSTFSWIADPANLPHWYPRIIPSSHDPNAVRFIRDDR